MVSLFFVTLEECVAVAAALTQNRFGVKVSSCFVPMKVFLMRVGLVGMLNYCIVPLIALLIFEVDKLSSARILGVARPLKIELRLSDTV